MSMTTGERYMELRAKIQELDLLAEHIPPAVLAERFVEIVEAHMERSGFPVETNGIRERVKTIEIPAPLDLPYPPPRWRSSAETETIEIPQGAPIEETQIQAHPGEEPIEEHPREKLLREGYEEMNERQEDDEEQEASAEPEKPCNTCGVTKPLSEFPRNPTYKDNHTNRCKPCTREYNRKRDEESKARRKAVRSSPATPSNVTAISRGKGAEASLCANGERCAAVDPDDLVPQPAILDEANPGPLCRRCKQRAGVA